MQGPLCSTMAVIPSQLWTIPDPSPDSGKPRGASSGSNHASSTASVSESTRKTPFQSGATRAFVRHPGRWKRAEDVHQSPGRKAAALDAGTVAIKRSSTGSSIRSITSVPKTESAAPQTPWVTPILHSQRFSTMSFCGGVRVAASSR